MLATADSVTVCSSTCICGPFVTFLIARFSVCAENKLSHSFYISFCDICGFLKFHNDVCVWVLIGGVYMAEQDVCISQVSVHYSIIMLPSFQCQFPVSLSFWLLKAIIVLQVWNTVLTHTSAHTCTWNLTIDETVTQSPLNIRWI